MSSYVLKRNPDKAEGQVCVSQREENGLIIIVLREQCNRVKSVIVATVQLH